MNKYIYGLITAGALSAVLIAGTGVASADTVVAPSPTDDLTTLNAEFNQDFIEWQVQLAGWTALVNKGELINNPTYQASMMNDLSAMTGNLALFSQDYEGFGQ